MLAASVLVGWFRYLVYPLVVNPGFFYFSLYYFLIVCVCMSVLLHVQVPLENRCIFSGALFQYLEENRKWRNRFLFIPDSYSINYYDSKAVRKRNNMCF